MRVLRGVVYMTKSSGPRTEPWGTPQEDVYQEDSNQDVVVNSVKSSREVKWAKT